MFLPILFDIQRITNGLSCSNTIALLVWLGVQSEGARRVERRAGECAECGPGRAEREEGRVRWAREDRALG